MKSGRSQQGARSTGPRVVVLDIETAPLQSYHWGLWDQNISLEQIQIEWSILSISWKWLGEKKVHFKSTGGRGPEKVRDDSELLDVIWELLDEADIVVTQNGKRFDMKKINARMLMRGMKPYSPVKVIDTKVIADKHFGFTSTKLAWMSKHICKIKKSEHKKFPGFELWIECLKDNRAAWREMEEYNKIDVLSDEELYLAMRPWMEGHPNVAVYSSIEHVQCPKCGSENLQARGKSYTQAGQYHRFQCKDCGGWARSRYTLNSKGKRQVLLSN